MFIKAPAKLNLNLHIDSQKNKNGFYPVSFLNCQVNLFDEINIVKNKNNVIDLKCSYIKNSIKLFSTSLSFRPGLRPRSNNNSSNLRASDPAAVGERVEKLCPKISACYSEDCPADCLVYKTIKLLQEKFPKKSSGLSLKIKKNIPVKAGLGGGSSDAGAVLKYLNKTWKLNLSQKKLVELAAHIGKDVCYTSIGGLCKVFGVGERIERLKLRLPKLHLLIAIPDIKKPSTAWAYQNVDLSRIGKNEKKPDNIIRAIRDKNTREIAKNLHNDFEYSISKVFPEVNEIKRAMIKSGALNALLCGSGLSCFGVYLDLKSARAAFAMLKTRFRKIFVVNTI
jgi:4-diphosphocytidyl-2-C-methyl-D-erythritol kinase